MKATQGDDNGKACQILYNFFNTELWIPLDGLQHIHIIRAHQIGTKYMYSRSIVVTVNDVSNLAVHTELKRN